MNENAICIWHRDFLGRSEANMSVRGGGAGGYKLFTLWETWIKAIRKTAAITKFFFSFPHLLWRIRWGLSLYSSWSVGVSTQRPPFPLVSLTSRKTFCVLPVRALVMAKSRSDRTHQDCSNNNSSLCNAFDDSKVSATWSKDSISIPKPHATSFASLRTLALNEEILANLIFAGIKFFSSSPSRKYAVKYILSRPTWRFVVYLINFFSSEVHLQSVWPFPLISALSRLAVWYIRLIYKHGWCHTPCDFVV